MIAELVCSAVALLLYVNTLDADFCYDDSRAIRSNQDLLLETPWINIFYDDFWGTLLTHSGSHKSYRPLCTLSFRLNHALGGAGALGWRAWWGGPIWGQGSSSCCLCCATPGTVALRSGPSPSVSPAPSSSPTHWWLWLLASLLLAACSMLWKEQGLTVLGVAAAYDLFICHRLRLIHLLCQRKSFSLLLSMSTVAVWGAVLLGVRLYWMGNKPPIFSNSDNPAADSQSLLTRTLTFLYLPAANFWLLLCPNTLSFDWSMDALPLLTGLSDWRNLHTATFYTGLLLLVHFGLRSPAADRHTDGNAHITNGNAHITNSNAHITYGKPGINRHSCSPELANGEPGDDISGAPWSLAGGSGRGPMAQ
ncbi:hypothetical protein SKAU_G00042220 [Synaphobranchus kaupii]|uniref:DUF1736 domain-containing protein n=1 Tax=Synaphobranchus kaupii TaxID=118154 RepID=A0A9Q1G1E1_SYNKA|nr:hypothetical protein SKAU_G00042220 [Synaphobranchus kaupii]